jgi:hypothetical protein
MLISLHRIEPEGRAVILDGLAKIACLRDLQAALAEPGAEAVELDFQNLVDIEVRASAGVFFGLCRSLPIGYPKTFEFCHSMLELLNAEFDRRRGQINAN